MKGLKFGPGGREGKGVGGLAEEVDNWEVEDDEGKR